jgi:4,5-DOPA dioxygenase extradiol
MTYRMPALFFGHGSPMNALEDNAYTRAWSAAVAGLVRPRAILAVSAHWYVDGTRVTANDRPPTIHDFGGFPRPLHEFAYPAPGDPAFAAEVAASLAPLDVTADGRWGLDHGTWSVLAHVYPHADVPVVQLGIDATQPAAFHFELGRRLAPLRDSGVLIIGSGNVVHNLRAMMLGQPNGDDWAARFEARIRALAADGETQPLLDTAGLGPEAALAIPTPEHYLPFLYVLGTRQIGEAVAFPTAGIEAGAISMLSMRVG